jgi:hypothetical protein
VDRLNAHAASKMVRRTGVPLFDSAPPEDGVACEWIARQILGLRWAGKVDAKVMQLGLRKLSQLASKSRSVVKFVLCDTTEVTGFSHISAEARNILGLLKSLECRTIVVMPHGGVRAFTFAVAMGVGLRVETHATIEGALREIPLT